MKISEKVVAGLKEGKPQFSFEFFPPKTQDGVENLFDRMDRLAALRPSFCDITWGAGGSTAELTLDIADKMQNMICVETSMHVTCTNMPATKVDEALDHIKAAGIQNVLALRGDPPHGQDKFQTVEGGFSCALDLVKHIREKYGDYFGITVAGYPEAHPDVIGADGLASEEAYRSDLEYLKKKVDAGADMIITQLFYDVDRFLKFVNDCREMGITVPIIPGIMPLSSYGGFKRMTGFCKTRIPPEIWAALEPIKDNEEAVKAYGIQLGTDMCRKILASGIQTLHLYTLNLEKAAVGILKNLGLVDESKIYRSLPWRPPTNVKRSSEDVRPIHWANRPRSYISRTAAWNEYPRGRWGDARSPSYGTLSDYQFARRKSRNKLLQEEWAVPLTSTDDVQKLFVRYCEGQMKTFPWSEVEGGLHPETSHINTELLSLNQQGFLTINSQPAVNGAPSTSPTVGWGPPGGRVYQKAYVEFFASPTQLQGLLARLPKFPELTLMAVNAKGETQQSAGGGGVNAVTWGVFRSSEVLQPSVVDPASFLVWKDEAFGAWNEEWMPLYSEADETSKKVLQEIHDTYFLVSIVDNDFVDPNLFSVFKEE
eukprot:TRINITY_DN32499_c0_g1_i1.p1 TRINITY_DN32499_c0_g1~~TRINITY_DN32499_c0_g1_i1.p1  ORF type:complete len:597 (-),score=129.56 TRINITY_DN32499_c0_g1_i1:465-2255(-)